MTFPSRSSTKIALITAAAVLTFQSSGVVATLVKLAVFASIVLTAIPGWSYSAWVVGELAMSRWSRRFQISVSAAALILLLSLPVAWLNKASVVNWFRDFSGAALIVLGCSSGAYLGRRVSIKKVNLLISLSSCLTGASYFVYWSVARNLLPSGVERLGLASWTMPLFGGIYLHLYRGPKTTLERATPILVIVMLVLSGSRTAIIPVVLLLVAAAFNSLRTRGRQRKASRFGRRLRVAGLLLFLVALAGSFVQANWSDLGSRFVSAFGLSAKRNLDMSYRERSLLTSIITLCWGSDRVISIAGDSLARQNRVSIWKRLLLFSRNSGWLVLRRCYFF